MVLVTEVFARLAAVTLEARKLSQALAIVIRGNPEFFAAEVLEDVADRALDEAVRRLTTGEGAMEPI